MGVEQGVQPEAERSAPCEPSYPAGGRASGARRALGTRKEVLGFIDFLAFN